MKTWLISGIGFGLAALTGCVGGPTRDFYHPVGVVEKHKLRGDPQLVQCERVRSEVAQRADNYRVIGECNYYGKYPEPVELRKQAKRVGAAIVIYAATFQGTDHGVNSVTVPNPNQVETTQTYGSGGYSHTTRTTSGGVSTYDIPWSAPRYEVHEVFLAREK